MKSAWIWVLVVGIVLFVIFIGLYYKGRENDIGPWIWGLLFLSLLIILVAAIIQILTSGDVPPMGEIIYHKPGWLESSEYQQGYYPPRGITDYRMMGYGYNPNAYQNSYQNPGYGQNSYYPPDLGTYSSYYSKGLATVPQMDSGPGILDNRRVTFSL